jgi:hypothetical protein
MLRGMSLWSLAWVEERFGERSLKVPKLVILRGSFTAANRSQEYFMESTGYSFTILD